MPASPASEVAETIAVGTATVANIHTDKKVANAFFFMFLTPFIHLFENFLILSTITLTQLQ